jgi:hypothetical protein
MIQLYATLTALVSTARQRVGSRGERGSVTLEQVIIALGLFLLATAVIAAITAAVNTRLGQIN